MSRIIVVPRGTPWKEFPPYSGYDSRSRAEKYQQSLISSGSLPVPISEDEVAGAAAWVRAYASQYPAGSPHDYYMIVRTGYRWKYEPPTHNEYGEVAP